MVDHYRGHDFIFCGKMV